MRSASARASALLPVAVGPPMARTGRGGGGVTGGVYPRWGARSERVGGRAFGARWGARVRSALGGARSDQRGRGGLGWAAGWRDRSGWHPMRWGALATRWPAAQPRTDH